MMGRKSLTISAATDWGNEWIVGKSDLKTDASLVRLVWTHQRQSDTCRRVETYFSPKKYGPSPSRRCMGSSTPLARLTTYRLVISHLKHERQVSSQTSSSPNFCFLSSASLPALHPLQARGATVPPGPTIMTSSTLFLSSATASPIRPSINIMLQKRDHDVPSFNPPTPHSPT
jgi:hypothetical protein